MRRRDDDNDTASRVDGGCCSHQEQASSSNLLDALDLVLNLHVELAQALELLLGGVPVPAAVRLEEGRHHLAEAVGVGLEQALLHLLVLNEGGVGLVVHPVVHRAGGGGPAHGVGQALLDLAHALVAGGKHALVPLGVEHLGAAVQAHRLGQTADLGVGGGGVRHVRVGHLAVRAQALHQLGGVAVEVVAHVRQRDLARVEVLEGGVHRLQGRLEHRAALLHAGAGGVRVEGERLAGQVHLLQLGLVVPGGVLHRQVDVGGVRAGRVGEDAGGRLAQGAVELLRLLQGVLAHKVHLQGLLLLLGGELHGAVQQVHLVHEQVAEDAGAVHHHVDAGAAELLEGDELELVHAAEGVGHGAHAHHPHHLREGLAVRLDVVRAPQHQGDGLGPVAIVLDLLALNQALHHHARRLHGRRGGDRLGVQGVDVLAGGEHVGVADGVAAGAGEDVVAVERLLERAQLVVLHHLLQAELEVVELRLQVRGLGALELGALQGAHPGGHVAGEHGGEAGQAHAAVGAGGLHHELLHHVAGHQLDVLEEGHVLEHALVGGAVQLLDVAADRGGQDAGEADQVVLGAVDRGDVHQGGHRLLSGGRAAHHVQAAGQQAGLNLHELPVDRADNVVALLVGQVLRHLGERHVAVEVALRRLGDDGVDDGEAAAGVLEGLVRGDELGELLEALVEAGVLRGGGEVGDGVGVGAALGDGRLRGVVGGVVVQVGDGADQAVGVARLGHAHLLAGHELEGAVGAEVQARVGAEHLLDVCVVGGEAVVGGRRLGEQQAHGVALVPEGGLHADEHVAVALAVHQHALAVRVQVAGGRAPVLVEVGLVVAQLLVLLHRHLVLDVQLRGVELGLLVVEHRLDEPRLRLGELAHVVALLLQHVEALPDGAEHVEVRGGAHVALVGGEGEDGDAQLLLGVLLLAEGGPLDGTVGHRLHAVVEGVGAARRLVAAGEDDGLHAAVELGQRHLERHLDGVQAEGGVGPLLGGLEHQRHRHHVGHVQAAQRLHGLGGVLLGGATHKGEASEGHHGVHKRVLGDGVVEVLVHGAGEVKATSEDGHNLGTLGLHLLHHSGVVTLVTGHQVGALQHEADHDGVRRELLVLAGVIPVEVLLEVLVHGRGSRVPDAHVGEHNRLRNRHLSTGEVLHVLLGKHKKEVLQVLGRATQPVLEGLHEVLRVLCLVRGKVLQHLGQGADQLQQTILETGSALGALLLHERSNGRLGLTDLGHGECAKLVQLHDLGHGGEHQDGIHALALGRDDRDNLVSELLNEDEGGDEHVSLLHIGLELVVVGLAAELLQQVAGNLEAQVLVVGVDGVHGSGEGGLILSLQDNVDKLDHFAAVGLGHDLANVRVDVGEATTAGPAGEVLDLILGARGVCDGVHRQPRAARAGLALQASIDLLHSRADGVRGAQGLGDRKERVGAGCACDIVGGLGGDRLRDSGAGSHFCGTGGCLG
mmetsp:Transcript_27247/g.59503  ORF Transcript_27247/g.59503 Transcript_27247/m.59503 type:complete len:1448 (-) Transcript_27247:88-4431(-)